MITNKFCYIKVKGGYTEWERERPGRGGRGERERERERERRVLTIK